MLTYQECGVDPNKNDVLVEEISKIAGISTGFANMVEIPGTDQFLVQCSDGVGTKILIAETYPDLYKTIGQDLVAMCINDLICVGAVPLTFQDYIGMNTLEQDVVLQIIESIYDACKMGNVSLTGGEMAEMPGIYKHNTPELVGFATGIATKETILDNKRVKVGDKIIGLEAYGPHSNGYSLIRRVMTAYNDSFPSSILQSILSPTAIYYEVGEFHQNNPEIIHSMAHITGGGLESNLKRAIPYGLSPYIQYNNWELPECFQVLQNIGNIDPDSMWETFNMGIGMCLIVGNGDYELVMDELEKYQPVIIGEII